MTKGTVINNPKKIMKNCRMSAIASANMPPKVVYKITMVPETRTATFKGIPVIVLITVAEAKTCDAVRQNNESTFKTAVKMLAYLPKRRCTTSGIVTAIVFLIFGAKNESGIIATAAAKTYQAALKPQPSKALAATPVVLPPPTLLAAREQAIISTPMFLPASI